MKRFKILIFPAGTEIAFEIQNALKFSKFVELYGANSIPSHEEFVFERCFEGVPFVNAPGFIEAMNTIVDQHGIDYIYPAHDSACLTLTEAADRIHAKIVTSPLKTVEICRSKNKTYEYFSNRGFIPKFYHSVEEITEYPVFIKPAIGQGSEGAKKIACQEDLIRETQSGTEYTICEYLPGCEYTVDCFTDKNKTLRVCHQRQRERIRTGIAVRSRLIPTEPEIWNIAKDINSELEFNGAWFFQVKKNIKGEYRLLEISSRIPGTMGTSRNLGINYPLLTLYNMWGYDVDIIDNGNEIVLDRAFISRYKTNINYNKVYLDFDDTVYIGNIINITIISFLYQCFNKKKEVILLTKHKNNIHESLSNFCISEKLFSEIVSIPQDEDKSKYIKPNNAIFIDDSFSERFNVHKKTGIPVFDLDMIESLLDWRM